MRVNMDLIVEGAIVGLAGEGVWRILSERVRVLNADEYGLEHDDLHDNGELIQAAFSYLEAADYAEGILKADITDGRVLMQPRIWPWNSGSWNPEPDPVRNLEKAGQLIAAEIDRLKRKEARDE